MSKQYRSTDCTLSMIVPDQRELRDRLYDEMVAMGEGYDDLTPDDALEGHPDLGIDPIWRYRR